MDKFFVFYNVFFLVTLFAYSEGRKRPAQHPDGPYKVQGIDRNVENPSDLSHLKIPTLEVSELMQSPNISHENPFEKQTHYRKRGKQHNPHRIPRRFRGNGLKHKRQQGEWGKSVRNNDFRDKFPSLDYDNRDSAVQGRNIRRAEGGFEMLQPPFSPRVADFDDYNTEEELEYLDVAARTGAENAIPSLDGGNMVAFTNWKEYVTGRQAKHLADPTKAQIYTRTGYLPVVQPDAHFRYIDKLFKAKNDRVKAFHRLYVFIHTQEQSTRTPV